MILGYTMISPYVDCENIWEAYPDVDDFIDKFCEVDTHESLHKTIIEICRSGHELVISKMM